MRKTNFLKNWIGELPNLEYILSAEDKKILNTIDPLDYADHNFTKESEVVAIINRHKPQLHRWIKLFPGLGTLSPKEKCYLDKLYLPEIFSSDLSEEDVRRIISYKIKEQEEKEKRRKEEVSKKPSEEQIKANNTLNRVARGMRGVLICGAAIITIGMIGANTVPEKIAILIGGVAALAAIWVTAAKTKIKTVRKKDTKEKLIFAIFFFSIMVLACQIGTGILGGALISGLVFGWEKIGTAIWIGLGTIVIPTICIIGEVIFWSENK